MCGEGEISASKGDREETRDEENRPLSPDDINQQYSAWNRSIKSMVLIRS